MDISTRDTSTPPARGVRLRLLCAGTLVLLVTAAATVAAHSLVPDTWAWVGRVVAMAAAAGLLYVTASLVDAAGSGAGSPDPRPSVPGLPRAR